MRHLALFAASVALLASGAAYAAEEVEGSVTSVNVANGTLTLQSGQTFTFTNPAVLYGILPGQNVGVTYTGQNQGITAFDPHPESDGEYGNY
ncbi:MULTISPECIES: DUF1344 domain-containing protein [Kaistia]|uniref:DUF1344 domain-containing protein n=1 Tax=Kaistia nematophila TaxID=2994654 RepID=A0A9X3ILM1_9HYPH|nr:DUF1344 domain-containing protein [Kaistia nematophila]MBN9025459.1 DUF1344 domain-containing protein [Hyphomicrobiales bacterium]MCX5570814.1 DUF1344 domain-containing protein [Kaistia nematophila]